MRYYLIGQDKGYAKVPKMLDAFKRLSANQSRPPSQENLERRTIITMNSEPDTISPDIFMGTFFLISEEMKECMALYEPNMNFKEIILLDKKRKVMQNYFLPQIVELDCLTENRGFGFGHYELKNIEIDEKKLRDKAIFRLAGIEKDYFIMRLDLLESILRRGAKGITAEEVQVRSEK